MSAGRPPSKTSSLSARFLFVSTPPTCRLSSTKPRRGSCGQARPPSTSEEAWRRVSMFQFTSTARRARQSPGV
eukprot:2764222-Pyramimonas_sp.AAC.1